MNQLRPFAAGAVWVLFSLALAVYLVMRATNLPTYPVPEPTREATDG